MKATDVFKIWRKRNEILEGIANSVFKQEHVEAVAASRLNICRSNKCGFHDSLGSSEVAVIKGQESCASCGCTLSLKTRALSDDCPKGFWQAELTDLEEAYLNEKLLESKASDDQASGTKNLSGTGADHSKSG